MGKPIDSERFPLDFEKLQRGDKFTTQECERMTNCRVTSDNYWHELLDIKEQIEDYFETDRKDDVVVRTCDNGLQILTHSEQADYCEQDAHRKLRGYGRAYRKGVAVDVLQLDDDRKVRHERFLHITAFRLQQLRKRPPPKLTNGPDDPKQLTE